MSTIKLSGPIENLKKGSGFNGTEKNIKMDDAKPAEQFLECNHKIVEKQTLKGIHPILGAGENFQSSETVKVKAMIYDMATFLSPCVDRYLELSKVD